jgi:hypothetical protein
MTEDKAREASQRMRMRYVEIWPKILDPWTQYLISARAAFDGDLDKMVILAVIGLMSFQGTALGARAPLVLSYDELAKLDMASVAARPINIESIALYTGIPRESVRRKVHELVDRKWIAQDARGYLVVLPAAATDLEPLSSQLFHLIGQISRAIGDPPDAPAAADQAG